MPYQGKDKLILKGLGVADGEYACDLGELISIGGKEALTLREQHQIKLVSGVRGAEIEDAVIGLDAAVMVALVGIIVRRHRKNIADDRVWQTHMIFASEGAHPDLDDYPAAVVWVVYDRTTAEEPEEEPDDADPPVPEPPPTEKPSTSGGSSSSLTSAPLVNALSRIGPPVSETRSVDRGSVRVTSGT